MAGLEELRRSFQPSRITTLFVGESPPRSGKFFYSHNTGLYRAIKQAFNGSNDFLSDFSARGFYLDDLSLIPVNGMAPRERSEQCKASIPSFSRRLREYQPASIVILLRSIDKWVREAAAQAKLEVPVYSVTYPGRFQKLRETFQNEIAIINPQLLIESK